MATKPKRPLGREAKAKLRENVGDLASRLRRVYDLSDPAKGLADSTELDLEIDKVNDMLSHEHFSCHYPFMCNLSSTGAKPKKRASRRVPRSRAKSESA